MKNTNLTLVLVGLASALFFSSTFILNRAMSIEGGHWFWSASLRYLYMILFLGVGLITFKGVTYFKSLFKEFFQHYIFWIVTGCIGFGSFYALLSFVADIAPAWIVATTWQLTIIASLIVLNAFGQKISRRTWVFMLIILVGIFFANFGQIEELPSKNLALSFFCILLAAFCYPIGNQFVWEAAKGNSLFPTIDSIFADDVFAKVLLLSIGSIPLWVVLYFFIEVGVPSNGQLFNTAFVAIFSGIVATSLFLYARNRADTPGKLAIVDGSQSGEVVFTLGGEMLFLGVIYPNMFGVLGLCLTLLGLLFLVYFEKS